MSTAIAFNTSLRVGTRLAKAVGRVGRVGRAMILARHHVPSHIPRVYNHAQRYHSTILRLVS